MNAVFIQNGRILAIDNRSINDFEHEELIDLLHDTVSQVLALQAMVERAEIKAHELQ